MRAAHLKAVAAILGLGLLPVAVTAADSLPGQVRADTLLLDREQVIRRTLDCNEQLAAAAEQKTAAAATALGAWSGFLPRVQVSEIFLRSDDALSSFGFKLNNRVVGPADFDPARLNDPGESSHYVTRISVQQPVFNGGTGIYGKQAADAMAGAAGHRLARARQQVAFETTRAFEGLRLAQSYTRVMEAAVASARGHLRQARALVEAEMATGADQLQAEVFLSGLEQRLIEIRNQAAVAREGLKLLMALDTDLVLAVPDGDEDTPAPALDPATPPAVGGRADLLARRQELRAAEKQVGVARGVLLPHVNLSLEKNYYSRESLFGDDAESWTLGVYGTWDIFRGLADVAGLKKARAERRALEYFYASEERQARTEVVAARLDAHAAAEKVRVAEAAVGAARESLRIISNQYREGLVDMTALLDVQNAATAAEGALVQARHDLQVNLARLELAAGVSR